MGPEARQFGKRGRFPHPSPTMNFDLAVMKEGEQSHKDEPQLSWTGLEKG